MGKNSTLIYSLNSLEKSDNFVFKLDAINPFGMEDYNLIEDYLNSEIKEISGLAIENIINYSKSSIV